MSLSNPRQSVCIASTRHLLLMLFLLACFPVVLRFTGALTVFQVGPETAGHTAALLRFCSVVTLYLWSLFLVVWVGVRSTTLIGLKSVIGTAKAGPAGLLKTAVATVMAFLAMLVVGGAANALIQRAGIGSGTMQSLTVRSSVEAMAFLGVALSAGFVEEVVFRGYLQQQIYARTGNVLIASVLQIAIFSAGHMYQGWVRMIPVALVGIVLTLAALWRKSLVPGMIAHGIGDGLMAIAFLLGTLTK